MVNDGFGALRIGRHGHVHTAAVIGVASMCREGRDAVEFKVVVFVAPHVSEILLNHLKIRVARIEAPASRRIGVAGPSRAGEGVDRGLAEEDEPGGAL